MLGPQPRQLVTQVGAGQPFPDRWPGRRSRDILTMPQPKEQVPRRATRLAVVATVLIVRHGRTHANAAGVLPGWAPGVRLDETGRAQATALGQRLVSSGLAVCRVVTSRCRVVSRPQLLAHPLGEGLPVLSDKRLAGGARSGPGPAGRWPIWPGTRCGRRPADAAAVFPGRARLRGRLVPWPPGRAARVVARGMASTTAVTARSGRGVGGGVARRPREGPTPWGCTWTCSNRITVDPASDRWCAAARAGRSWCGSTTSAGDLGGVLGAPDGGGDAGRRRRPGRAGAGGLGSAYAGLPSSAARAARRRHGRPPAGGPSSCRPAIEGAWWAALRGAAGRAGRPPGRPAQQDRGRRPPGPTDDAPLDTPIEDEFPGRRRLLLGWDPARRVGGALGAARAAAEQAEPTDAVHIVLAPEQARAFARRTKALVAVVAGGPLDPAGHICPRANRR